MVSSIEVVFVLTHKLVAAVLPQRDASSFSPRLSQLSFSPELLQIQPDKLETHNVMIFNKLYLQLYKL